MSSGGYSRDQKEEGWWAPFVNGKAWIAAQKMLDQNKDGRIKLGYQFGGGASFVMPSEKTLQIIPDAYDSLEAKKKYIETWAKEFIATMKNPSGYYKATPPPSPPLPAALVSGPTVAVRWLARRTSSRGTLTPSWTTSSPSGSSRLSPPTTRGLLFGHSLDVFAPFFSHCLCGIGDRPQERRHRVHLLVPAVPALLLLQARDWPGPLPQRGDCARPILPRARRSAQGSGGAKGDQAGQLPQNRRLLAAEQPPSEMR